MYMTTDEVLRSLTVYLETNNRHVSYSHSANAIGVAVPVFCERGNSYVRAGFIIDSLVVGLRFPMGNVTFSFRAVAGEALSALVVNP